MAEVKTMKAVVFDGPYKISIQDRPIPNLQDDGDIIVKVQATALCGSELHVYRGHQPSETGFIMGHEFTGIVTVAGSTVKTVKVGDKVVSPFTISCQKCFYCRKGFTSRCEKSRLFGSPALDGGQAEYVRVPLADGTVVKAPPEIDDRALVLMADIFPTGFFGAANAFQMLREQERGLPSSSPSPESKGEQQGGEGPVVVVVGCGPVGLCAVVSALEHRPRHLFAVDGVEGRLELARGLGAEPLNFATMDRDDMVRRVKEVSGGRGADAVIEVVGLSPALRTAFELLRPFGIISSIGVHNDKIPWSGSEAYNKNIKVQMGRCPVRGIFPDALAMLAKTQHKLSFMFDKIMPLEDAVEGYELFDKMKVQKVIFTP